MKKQACFLVMILAVCALSANAITKSELDSISIAATAPAIKAEQLDRFSSLMSGFNPANADEQQSFFQAQVALAEGYAMVNHFKPAYLTYKKYLEMKEAAMVIQFNSTVAKVKAAVREREKSLDEEMKVAGEESMRLKESTANYITLRSYYKRIFALSIITLTFIFAVVLVRSGMRLTSMSKETSAIRRQLKTDHRIASIGELSPGFLAGNESSLEKAGVLSHEIEEALQQQGTKNNGTEIKRMLATAGDLSAAVRKLNHQN